MHLSLKRAGFMSTLLGDALQYSYPIQKSATRKRVPGGRLWYWVAVLKRVAHNLEQDLFQALFPRGPGQPSPLLDPSA